MKHDDLQEDLASHLRGNTARMVWTNTQLGPSGSPRPDVFTVDKSFARFACDAYEIKVSVPDLRSDVTSGKWQSYRKFSHRVWFAFERGLAPLDLVPKECGVILRGEGGTWRAARKPVAQVLDTLPRDAWLKLLIEAHPENVFGQAIQPRRADEWSLSRRVREKFGAEVGELIDSRLSAKHSFEKRTAELAASADKIAAEIRDRRERAAADIEHNRLQLDEAMRDLGEQLGMPRDQINATTLRETMRSLRWKLHRGGLDGAIETLQRLKAITFGAENDTEKAAA